jgi:hypothetical protein
MRIGLLALVAIAVAAGCGGDSEGELPDAFVAVRSQDNPVVPSTNTFTELVRLALEPGRYQVTGKVELHNRDPESPFNMQCALVPSEPDGTAGEEGALASDAGFVHLGRSGGPGELGGIVLFVSQELSHAGSVVLGCSGYGNEHGAFAAYTSIRAIQVRSIATEYVTP